MGELIYFDNNATTRPRPEVVEAMLPFLRQEYGNPSSVHMFGQRMRHEVELAREKVAGLIGARPREIVFTSGGTECINLAVRGVLKTQPQKRHVITSAVEHSAARKVCDLLGDEGYEVDELGVDQQGRLDVDELEARLREDTALVTVMQANNETGVLFHVERIADMCQCHGVALHVDAVQAAGKVPIDISKMPVHLLSISAHKFHGPKGVGALYIRRRTRVQPLILGGSQERDTRGGTENVPGIVGMGAAAELAARQEAGENDRVRSLRDRLEAGICASVPFAHVNGGEAQRICNTTNIGFEGLEAEAILILLSENGVCASSGAACSSGSLEPSHVLKAMKIDERIAHGAIRFSLSLFNTQEEVDRVVGMMPELLTRLTVLSRG